MTQSRAYQNAKEGILLLEKAAGETSLDDRIHALLARTSQEDKGRFIAYFEAVLKKQP